MSSLRDGLGQEELSPSGVEISGTNAVYMSPYFLGSITSESNISGVNIYGTTLIKSATVAGTNLSGTTAVRAGDVYGANISGTTSVKTPYGSITAISGTGAVITTISGTSFVNSQGLLKSNKAGTLFGATVQAGSGTLSSNNLWVVFNTAYTGVPIVVTMCSVSGTNADVWAANGSIVAGSFCATGVGASDTFKWISVGI